VLHLGRKLRCFAGGDVRQIGNNEVEGAVDFFEQMTLRKMDALREAKPLSIFARQGERIFREIDRV